MFSSRFSRQPPLYEDGNHTLVVILTFALFVVFILIYLAAGLVWASPVTAAAVVLAFLYLKTRRCAALRRGRRAARVDGGGLQHAHQGTGGSSDAAAVLVTGIPAFAYKREGSDGGRAGWVQCVICLGMVKVGETVRQLPACRHLFHVECIDMWLHSHSSCPICRSIIFPAGRSTLPV